MAKPSEEDQFSLTLISRDLVPASTETTKPPRSSEEMLPVLEVVPEADATDLVPVPKTECTDTPLQTPQVLTTESQETPRMEVRRTTTEEVLAKEADPPLDLVLEAAPNPVLLSPLEVPNPQEAPPETAMTAEK
jgi:hypothetical protein